MLEQSKVKIGGNNRNTSPRSCYGNQNGQKREQGSTGTKAIQNHNFQHCNELLLFINQYSLLKEFQKFQIEKLSARKRKKRRNEQGPEQIRKGKSDNENEGLKKLRILLSNAQERFTEGRRIDQTQKTQIRRCATD